MYFFENNTFSVSFYSNSSKSGAKTTFRKLRKFRKISLENDFFGVKKSKSWKCSSLSVLNKNWIARREEDFMIPFWIWNSFELNDFDFPHSKIPSTALFLSKLTKNRQKWMKMIEIEWYWIKIGLFRIYSELFFDYFAILIIFE